MSHFVVLVVGENIEKQLEPFQEDSNNPEYLTFQDMTEEWLEEYNQIPDKAVKLSDESIINYYDNKFYIIDKDGYRIHIDDSELEIVSVPKSFFYKTFDNYVAEYYGQEKDKQTNKYGYWVNNNAKWDWYQVGGRWTGYFKLKPDCVEYTISEPGIMTEPAKPGYADSVRKCDIDFEFMKSEMGKKAEAKWTEIMELINYDIKDFIPWETYIKKVKDKSLDIETARTEYHKQELVKILSKKYLFEFEKVLTLSKEQYIQIIKDSAIVPFAILDKGDWIERGEMGWWGIVNNEKDKDTWVEDFNNFLINLNDNEILTIIDCHI